MVEPAAGNRHTDSVDIKPCTSRQIRGTEHPVSASASASRSSGRTVVACPDRHRSGERRALVVEGVTEQAVDHGHSVVEPPGQSRQQTQQRPGARHHASPVTGADVGVDAAPVIGPTVPAHGEAVMLAPKLRPHTDGVHWRTARIGHACGTATVARQPGGPWPCRQRH